MGKKIFDRVLNITANNKSSLAGGSPVYKQNTIFRSGPTSHSHKYLKEHLYLFIQKKAAPARPPSGPRTRIQLDHPLQPQADRFPQPIATPFLRAHEPGIQSGKYFYGENERREINIFFKKFQRSTSGTTSCSTTARRAALTT